MHSTELSSRVTGGVDTHKDFHVAAALDSVTGRQLATATFAAEPGGYAQLLGWLQDHGTVDVVGVEGTGMYGVGLTQALLSAGLVVVEVDRPDRQQRQRDGKTDALDALAAARAVLSGRARNHPKIKTGPTEAIRVTELVCHSAVKDRTRAINQFKSLLVTAPPALRATLTQFSFAQQLARVRRFRDRDQDLVTTHTRRGLKVLAQRIKFLNTQIRELESTLNELAAQASPSLLGLFGVGPHAAALLLATAGASPDRFATEAQFAKLCGVCPIPASSGKTSRHRLNRGGDRRANRALHTIVLVRMQYDQRTRDYVTKRTTQGLSTKEIMRCLKRYVAREVYHTLTNPPTDLLTGPQLRALRHANNQTLITTANALGTYMNDISRLERGITHNNQLNRRLQNWLTKPD